MFLSSFWTDNIFYGFRMLLHMGRFGLRHFLLYMKLYFLPKRMIHNFIHPQKTP